MPVIITASGSDENVLEQVLTDAGVAYALAGNVHEAVAAVAADFDVIIVPSSDRNMIEQLADALAGYVYRLDDDGTLAALVGTGYMPADAPDYLKARRVLATSGYTFTALPGEITDAVALPLGEDKTTVIQAAITAPFDAGMGNFYEVGLGFYCVSAADAPLGMVRVTAKVYANKTALTLQQGGTIINLPDEAADWLDGNTLTLEIDNAAGEVSARGWANVIDLPVGTAKCAPIIQVSEHAALSGAVLGQEAVITLRTRANDITGNAAANAVDIYGAPVEVE